MIAPGLGRLVIKEYSSARNILRSRQQQVRLFSRQQKQPQQLPRHNNLEVIQFRATAVGRWGQTDSSGDNSDTNLTPDATIFTPATTPTTAFDRGMDEKENISSLSAPCWQSSPHGHSPKKTVLAATTPGKVHFSKSLSTFLHWHIVRHFLPANYPQSVAAGYAPFCIRSACASVAGSAAMVLSTQTLLLAVGVVGSTTSLQEHHQQASIMAGALNWVLKDGVGQLGGVLFASRMGESKQLDANPKHWRLVAALCLDAAACIELLAPLAAVSSSNNNSNAIVLGLACTANVLKNIGFLTSSASRAALHQSVALSGNLADVTAKAASQSMAAGLLGTAVGVGLSTSVLHDNLVHFWMAFGGLAVMHQGFNYWALQAIGLRHLNKHRLYLLLSAYVENNNCDHGGGNNILQPVVVLSPQQVAQREVTFPIRFHPEDDSNEWLHIGNDLPTVCPGGAAELELLLNENKGNGDDDDNNAKFLVNYSLSQAEESADKMKIHLTFLEDAQGEDLIFGMLVAVLLRRNLLQQGRRQQKGSHHHDARSLVRCAHESARKRFPGLLAAMKELGWRTGTDETSIEPSGVVRFAIRGHEKRN